MEQTKVSGINVKCTLDYKGGSKDIQETMPFVSKEEDYIKQYIGIWKVMLEKVQEFSAKKVLEFGTREGYSTRLFSIALKPNDGKIFTVDMNAPKEPFSEENIVPIRSLVEDLDWSTPVDILYIDDWHNGHHLYYELNRFAKLARVVLIHDVCLDEELMNSVTEWCRHNWVIYTIYPVNGCGLAVLEIEKSGAFYKEKGA